MERTLPKQIGYPVFKWHLACKKPVRLALKEAFPDTKFRIVAWTSKSRLMRITGSHTRLFQVHCNHERIPREAFEVVKEAVRKVWIGSGYNYSRCVSSFVADRFIQVSEHLNLYG
jgi:hypothetical protein